MRDINFYAITKSIELLKSRPLSKPVRGMVLLLESNIHYLDSELTQYFIQLKKHLNQPNSPELIQVATNFKALKEKLDVLGNHIKQLAGHSTEPDTNTLLELQQLGDDILLISQHLPQADRFTQPEINTNNVYTMATSLGGTYIKISQSAFPTKGIEEEAGIIKPTGGNCGGMVMVWADECIKHGTPSYPISTNITTLRRQVNQSQLRATDYHPLASSLTVTETNLIEEIKKLTLNTPYYVVTIDKAIKSAHAFGLRKTTTFIEFFDPNKGYFFFRDAKAAGTLFAYILQSYQANNNFPSDLIHFYQHKQNSASLTAACFPNEKTLDDVMTLAHRERGYTELCNELAAHLQKIIQRHLPGRMLDSAIDAIKYFHANLQFEHERNTLYQLLGSLLEDGEEFNTAYQIFIKKEHFQTIKIAIQQRKYDINKLVGYLKSVESSYPLVSAPVLTMRAQIRRTTYKLSEQINTLATELKELRASQKNPEKELAIKIKLAVLSNVMTNILKQNIDGKLVAGFYGTLAYTEQDAIQELNKIIPTGTDDLTDQVNIDIIMQTIDTIKKIQQALSQLKPIINNKDDIYTGIYSPQHTKTCSIITSKINQVMDELEKEKDAIIKTGDINQNIIQQLPKLVANGGLDEYTLILKQYFENTIQPKFTTNEIRDLNFYYLSISSKNETSILWTLEKIKNEGLTSIQKQRFDEYMKQLVQFQLLLVDAVNPGTDKKYEFSHYDDFFKKIKLSDDFETSFRNFINIDKLPIKLSAMLDKMTDPCFDNIKHSIQQQIRFINDKKISIHEAINNIHHDLGLAPIHGLDAINIDAIESAINTVFQQLKMKADEEASVAREKAAVEKAAAEKLAAEKAAAEKATAEKLAAEKAAGETAAKSKFIAMIADDGYWSNKVSFSTKRAPIGILDLRQKITSAGINSDNSELFNIPSIINRTQRPSEFKFLFFSYQLRSNMTALTYDLVQSLSTGASLVGNKQYDSLVADFERYKQQENSLRYKHNYGIVR